MTTATNPLAVIFREFEGETLAIFPEMPWSRSPNECGSYARIGQHGACDPAHIIANSRPADPDKADALRRELESAPFEYSLRPLLRMTRKAVENRLAHLMGEPYNA